MLDRLFSFIAGKPVLERSPKWKEVRSRHLVTQPVCQVCGTSKGLEVHHIKPVHLYPLLELALDNLITLCETNQCHFLVGHCRDWKSYNPTVIRDTEILRIMIQSRVYQ